MHIHRLVYTTFHGPQTVTTLPDLVHITTGLCFETLVEQTTQVKRNRETTR